MLENIKNNLYGFIIHRTLIKERRKLMKKKIVKAFEKGKSVRKVVGVIYSDGTKGELYTYYPDEKPDFSQFIGLTREEAMKRR